jgi:hypothetical protein
MTFVNGTISSSGGRPIERASSGSRRGHDRGGEARRQIVQDLGGTLEGSARGNPVSPLRVWPHSQTRVRKQAPRASVFREVKG